MLLGRPWGRTTIGTCRVASPEPMLLSDGSSQPWLEEGILLAFDPCRQRRCALLPGGFLEASWRLPGAQRVLESDRQKRDPGSGISHLACPFKRPGTDRAQVQRARCVVAVVRCGCGACCALRARR